MTQAQLNGFFRPDYVGAERVMMRIGEPVADAMPWGAAPLTEIADARPLQAQAASVAAFFAEHGFALLGHPSAVTDWTTDPAGADTTSQAHRLYLPEVEALIRERLLPGQALQTWQRAGLVRRGPGADNGYAPAVHQDFGLSADDYAHNVVAFASEEAAARWRERYDRDDVEGFMVIDFWRPIGMGEPLRHMPLAVCDPASVDPADVVESGLLDFAPTGRPTRQVSLRYNPTQRWFYYPGMTVDEVLAFKIFHCQKAGARPSLRTCFHSAFADPTTPADAEPRKSCEHRAGVFLLRG